MNLTGKCLVFRQSRLGRLPPAQRACETLVEKDIPVVVIEFGEWGKPTNESNDLDLGFERIRLVEDWALWLPKSFQVPAAFLSIWLKLFFHIGIKNKRPALLIGNGLQEDWLVWSLGCLLRLPYAIFVHEIFNLQELSFFNRCLYRFIGPILRQAQFLTCPEPQRIQLLTQRHHLKKPIFLVPNCPRLRLNGWEIRRMTRKELKIPETSLVLSYVGGIGTDNYLELALRALVRVPHAHFLVMGWADKHYLRVLKSLGETLGISHRVHYLGATDQKWKYLDASDVGYAVYRGLYLRSQMAAMASNKLFEYFAAGLPTLVRKTPDFERVATRGGPCLFVHPLDPETLANQLLSLTPQILEGLQVKAVAAHRLSFHFEKPFQPVLDTLLKNYFPHSIARMAPVLSSEPQNMV